MADTNSQTTDHTSLFLEIVNAVLADAGRNPLPPSGSHRAIIEVRETDRVLQILAGPGSGKTEMLVWRILYELVVLGTPASDVIVTTFTRRAATELQVRLAERCDSFLEHARELHRGIPDPHIHDIRIGTIHSLCDALLAGFSDDFVSQGIQLIDDIETMVRLARNYRFSLGYRQGGQRLVNRLLGHEPLVALFRPPWAQDMWPNSNMERINFIKDVISQHTETWEPRCGASSTPNGVENVHGIAGLTDDLIELERRWREDHLGQQNLVDFTTIQKIFLSHQNDLLPHFRHVFVDEFQDTNPIQFAIHTRWLLNPGIRLTVVGDDDQAIYRFRGSDLECFQRLEPYCQANAIAYRLERLEVNYRSTQRIVAFTQAFRNATVLSSLSMPKQIRADAAAPQGGSVRLLEGAWQDLSEAVASELDTLGAGRIPNMGQEDLPPSAAILLFSTSERSSQDRTALALAMRRAIESHHLRTYNPRNKTAGHPDSPTGMLLGLISYLIDPITEEPVGKGNRRVMVWGSSDDPDKSDNARARGPGFPINQGHTDFQKKFRKAGGRDIGLTPPARRDLLSLVDTIRDTLADPNRRRPARLTLAGLVYRLLAQPFFRQSGFTMEMFRQALFTQLMEANIAPTRLTQGSLDQPLEVSVQGGKYVWPDRFWNLLNHFGALLEGTPMDDLEVESFEDNAILLITFHQAKGLEFDHVYVGAMGRTPEVTPVLRTKLFSGQRPAFRVEDGVATTRNSQVRRLSEADREREVYVAMTRARKSLTLLHDPGATADYMQPNRAVAHLFSNRRATRHPVIPSVDVKEWPNG